MNPYNKMKKHAVEVGNQQKLQTLGEVNPGTHISEDRIIIRALL
jgi:hypothetical protein